MKTQRERIEKIKRNGLPHGAGRMMAGAEAALLIILIVALPLLATSCRDRDDEPSAGGRLVTVSRLRVSIDGMQSAAEMKAARSAQMKAGRNEALAGGGGEIRSGAQTRNGGEIRNGGNTRANTSDPEPDDKGYVGVVKTEFVAGDVLHFMVTLTEADLWTPQVSNAILQDNGTWLFDTPLVLPEDATKTRKIDVFYDDTKRLYTYYSTNTGGDYTAANGNANAAYRDAMSGTKDDDTNLTTYPDLLYVWDYSGNWADITLTPDGTLTLRLEHDNSLVRISSIDNRLGAKVTAIHANTTGHSGELAPVSLYPAATTTSSGAAPSADDASAAAANGTVEAVIGNTGGSPSYLQSFTVTLDDGHKVIVPVPDGHGGQGGINYNRGRYLSRGASYTYRLLLLPGSVSAEEVNGAAPSYQVRRDPAVPAGYIPIYTAEDLRKIGQKDTNGKDYLPAIVNGYLYTNASSALLAAEAQKDPTVDPTTGAYTDSGYSEEATKAAIAPNGIAPGADATSDGSIDGTPTKVGPLTFSLDARYILMNDIDLTPKDGPAIGKDLNGIDVLLASHPEQLWTPIGKDENTPFKGRFHGNGFTIRGMTINSDEMYVGLFGCTGGAVIYNVHLQDARVKGTNQRYCSIGSLVGSCQYSTISSCSATGCALQGAANNSYIGGLVGYNKYGTFTHCHTTACITLSDAAMSTGGLAARNIYGTLVSCYTTGCTASCTNGSSSFSGLVNNNDNDGIIYGCYTTYAQKSGTSVGSFSLLVQTNSGTIVSSYAINAKDGTLKLRGNNFASGTITACVSPYKNSSSLGSGSGDEPYGGGSYWEIIQNGDGNFSGGYAPLTNDALLETLKDVKDQDGNYPFTTEGNLADVYTLLVNNTGGDITDTDVGGGDISGLARGKLKTIPPGGLYTVKREWKASRIWGDTTPKSLTVVLPRIDWTYNRE